MAYIEVSREHWTTGKRKKTYFAWSEPFDISDDLWIQLQKFAAEDDFSYTAHYDWENGMIRVQRSEALDDVFKTYCRAPTDWKLFHDVVEYESGEIKMTPMQFKYEYFVEVLKFDAGKQRAYIKHFPTNKQIDEGIFFETKEYWVDVSDRCVFEKIKPEDVVCIRKFLDDSYLAVYVSESAPTEEERKQRAKEQRKALNDLMGDY